MNQFERAQVIMLPAKELLDAYKGPITRVYEDGGKLYLNKKEIGELITEIGSPQHLYITSDDKINEDDFILTFTHAYGWNIDQIKEVRGTTYFSVRNELLLKESIKGKIIATTDTSLRVYKPCIQCDGTGETVFSGTYTTQKKRDLCSQLKYPNTKSLPQPSQQFIEKYIEEYNKGNIITDILVEYEDKGREDVFENWIEKEQLKVNLKDNTITIKKLKDSWNRSEIEEKLFEALTADGPGAFNMGWESKDARDWIAQNL